MANNDSIQYQTEDSVLNYKENKIHLDKNKINEKIKSEKKEEFIQPEEKLLIKEDGKYIEKTCNKVEEEKKSEEPMIPLDIKAINISAHINRLKKINMNKKNHKKKKIRAINQYNPPQNIQFNPNPINYPKFPIPYSQNRNNIINNNQQFMNYKFGQNSQYMKNNNNQLINNNFGLNMNNNRNNNGFNVNNNFNNFNQNINNMNNPNNMQLMQQLLFAMNNMKGNNPSMNNNELLMNMLNKINQQNNNIQNQNNSLNLNLLPFLVNNNKDNQEEISIIRTIRENTDKGQKIYKVKVSTSMVKNDKKGKYQK